MSLNQQLTTKVLTSCLSSEIHLLHLLTLPAQLDSRILILKSRAQDQEHITWILKWIKQGRILFQNSWEVCVELIINLTDIHLLITKILPHQGLETTDYQVISDTMNPKRKLMRPKMWGHQLLKKWEEVLASQLSTELIRRVFDCSFYSVLTKYRRKNYIH